MTHPRDIGITTASGRTIFPFRTPEEIAPHIHLADAAHSLSNLVRYVGATRVFYAVSQHVVLGSRLIEHLYARSRDPAHREWANLAYEFLHHDDSEYVLGDLPGPIKSVDSALPRGVAEALGLAEFSLAAYHRAERNVQGACALAFQLKPIPPSENLSAPIALSPVIHAFDRLMLWAEKWMLMPLTEMEQQIVGRFEGGWIPARIAAALERDPPREFKALGFGAADIPHFFWEALNAPWYSGFGRQPYLDAHTRLDRLRGEQAQEAALAQRLLTVGVERTLSRLELEP